MTPRLPLLLAVLCAFPAVAAEPGPAEARAKEPAARVARKYRRPRNSVSLDGAIAVSAIQCHLRTGDGASTGGADHAASNAASACWNEAGQCLVLLPQLEDMIFAHGDKVSPHVYAVADVVLGAAAKKYGSFSKLDDALLASSEAPGDSYECSGRVNPNVGAPASVSAASHALTIIRRSLKSARVISGTLLGDAAPLAAHAARWAGEFDDAGSYLEADLKAQLSSSDARVLDETVKTLGERVRNPDTAARLLGLFLDKKNGKRKLDEALKIRILASMRMTVSTAWPMGHDKEKDSIWKPADVEAGRRYFHFACGLLVDEGCADKEGRDTGAVKPVCAAARELLIFAPKPHKASCERKSGAPPGPKCL